MSEGLFVLTIIFVAYVVYQVVNDKKTVVNPPKKGSEPEKKAAHVEPPKPAPAKKEAPKAPEPAVTQAPTPVAAAAPAEPATKPGLRDPKTGEVVTAFTNYRFAKRWIKDALVAEGLLDKVYKNNEIDAAAEAKIKAALTKLEALDKYRA